MYFCVCCITEFLLDLPAQPPLLSPQWVTLDCPCHRRICTTCFPNLHRTSHATHGYGKCPTCRMPFSNDLATCTTATLRDNIDNVFVWILSLPTERRLGYVEHSKIMERFKMRFCAELRSVNSLFTQLFSPHGLGLSVIEDPVLHQCCVDTCRNCGLKLDVKNVVMIRVFTLFLPMLWLDLPTNQAQNWPRFPLMYHLATCNAPQAQMSHG